MPEHEVQTVSWINVVPLNRREKLARWWREDVREGSTYTSERQRKEEFTTAIPVGEIEQLACEGLRRALGDQKRDRETDASMVTIPRATPDGSRYFGSIAIPTRPIGVRFTEQGIVSTTNENH